METHSHDVNPFAERELGLIALRSAHARISSGELPGEGSAYRLYDRTFFEHEFPEILEITSSIRITTRKLKRC